MFKACAQDIKSQCKDELERVKSKADAEHSIEEYQGVIINCLRLKFAEKVKGNIGD